MLRHAMLSAWALLMLSVLVACGNASGPAGSSAATAVPATNAPSAVRATTGPTTAPAPAAPTTQAQTSAGIPEGLTAEGYHMLGRPDAPVTLVMYSDFL